MSTFKKVDLSFQSCKSEYKDADVVIFSTPFDATTSFRPGARFGGNYVRLDSIGLEWYSPYRDANLQDYKTCDIGDLDLPVGNVPKVLDIIYDTTKQILKDNKTPVMVGGEHLASLPVIKAMYEKYPDLHVIHFDAHTDLREEFLGMELSHATFLRHCHKFLGDGRIFQFGIRSGSIEEFNWINEGHVYSHRYDLETLDEICMKIKDKPVYITIDLDILDPGLFPGTGTPEPGGLSFKEFLVGFDHFDNILNNIVGADLMELAPMLDPSGISNAAAGKALREMVLLIHKKLEKK